MFQKGKRCHKKGQKTSKSSKERNLDMATEKEGGESYKSDAF